VTSTTSPPGSPPTGGTASRWNLAAVADEQASLEMIAETDKAGSIIARAGQVTAAVREQIRA
jgi:hypothetical protein